MTVKIHSHQAKAKALSFPGGFQGNLIGCIHRAVKKILSHSLRLDVNEPLMSLGQLAH